MRFRWFLIFVALMFGCGRTSVDPGSSQANSAATADRGDQIVAEYLKRDAAPFRKMRVRFTIRTEGEADEIYEIDSWRKQTPDSTTTLSQIIKPDEDRDGGSLTLEVKEQKTVVVTYSQARGEFRETDTSKMFFGGLTTGELLGEWGKFSFREVGEKQLDDRKVAEVEGKLKAGETSVASKMNATFRTDNYVPVEVHMFDINDREIRTYRSVEYKDEPEHPYASKTEVENPIRKARITIEILSREYPTSIDESMFVRDKLKSFVRK